MLGRRLHAPAVSHELEPILAPHTPIELELDARTYGHRQIDRWKIPDEHGPYRRAREDSHAIPALSDGRRRGRPALRGLPDDQPGGRPLRHDQQRADESCQVATAGIYGCLAAALAAPSDRTIAASAATLTVAAVRRPAAAIAVAAATPTIADAAARAADVAAAGCNLRGLRREPDWPRPCVQSAGQVLLHLPELLQRGDRRYQRLRQILSLAHSPWLWPWPHFYRRRADLVHQREQRAQQQRRDGPPVLWLTQHAVPNGRSTEIYDVATAAGPVSSSAAGPGVHPSAAVPVAAVALRQAAAAVPFATGKLTMPELVPLSP